MPSYSEGQYLRLIAPLPRLDMTHKNRHFHQCSLVLACMLFACMDQEAISPQRVDLSAQRALEERASSAVSCESGCDDFDPCTEDLCSENMCSHTLISGCTIYACNSLGTMDTLALADLEAGDLWKASGTPSPSGEPSECTNQLCEGEELCCNTCAVALQLEVEGVGLERVRTDQNLPWTCTSDECGVTSSCEPLSLDAAYWLWGRVSEDDGARDYVVQGWCLQTTTEALPGEYVGSWVSGSAEAHTVQLSIEHQGTWSISIKDLRECPACDVTVPMQFASNIAIRDGALEFDMAVCKGGGSCVSGDVPVRVTLTSHRDQLIGTFAESQNFGGGFGVLYSGAVGLERTSP